MQMDEIQITPSIDEVDLEPTDTFEPNSTNVKVPDTRIGEKFTESGPRPVREFWLQHVAEIAQSVD